MLLFIESYDHNANGNRNISIHPMLLFITIHTHFIKILWTFQYIPCYCLSDFDLDHGTSDEYFNTSHVTVYLSLTLYSIATFFHFNTSHVTVYHDCCHDLRVRVSRFQYIPCYCLSSCYNTYKPKSKGFQYIPCYCLSNEFKPFFQQPPSSFPLFYAISTFFTSLL